MKSQSCILFCEAFPIITILYLLCKIAKVQQRTLSLEFCPWCSSKGLSYGLHLYHINLQESITLCTNPECLFPLVSRPLEDVLASLVPNEPPIRGKSRLSAADQEELMKPANKRLRSQEPDAPLVQEEHSAAKCDSGGLTEKDSQPLNGYPSDSSVTEELDSVRNGQNDLGTETATPVPAPPCSTLAEPCQSSSHTLCTTDVEPASSPHDSTTGNDGFDPPQRHSRCSSLDPHQACHSDIEATTAAPQFTANAGSALQESTDGSIPPPCVTAQGVGSLEYESSSGMVAQSVVFVPIPEKLFWSNSNNLCWLDSMLVALVNCESLRKLQPQDQPQEFSVWWLIREYEAVCAAVQVCKQPGKDGTMRVPRDVLQKAYQNLHSLRMSVFKLLQPKLQCKLGQRETPVFALPLLLAMDLWAEPLFQSTFQWEFTCSGCQIVTRERVTKTLPTLTNILPEWSPLNAVHSAACNACGRKNQRRALMLERTSPVLALHFVQGLPENNVGKYAFTFQGMYYRITTVIQYDQRLQHFVTWVACTDGSWLEFDDLKHQECKIHQMFPVRAEEIHIVFWEGEQAQEPPASRSPLLDSLLNFSHPDGAMSEKPAELSLLLPHDDTDIVCALGAAAENDDQGCSSTAGAPAPVDTSISSSMLLDTFEGLSHDDIVTLTLVEITAGQDEPPTGAAEQSQGTDPMQDTSWMVGPGDLPAEELTNTTGPDDGSACQPALSPSPAPEPATVLTPEPEPAPAPSPSPAARRGRSKAISRRPQKKSECSLQMPPVSSTNPSEMVVPPAPVTLPVPPSPLPPAPAPSQVMPTSLLAGRWSFLLSRNPNRASPQATDKLLPSPATSRPHRAPPLHSTPDQARRLLPVFAKPSPPPMKLEAGEGLPLKAAEMYDGFGKKSSQSQLQPPPFTEPPSSRPSLHHKTTNNSAVVGATGPLEVLSKKLHSSKVPPGLSEKERQRYKQVKKLKAMKKKLAKLNQLLGHQDWPDSTGAGSPATVTSSTYESSVCDDLLLDLLSPATTASNLSPDSTGYLELLPNGQEGGEQLDVGAAPSPQANHTHPAENFLEDFLSQAVAQRPTEMEAEMLSALDLFV